MIIKLRQEFVIELWTLLCQISPPLLFGFFIAGLLSVIISPEYVERHLGGRKLLSIFKACLFGIPLPLCSCGVIPVSASLRRHGASKGAVTAFIISTPQTGVDSIFITYSLLGPVFAIFRPLAALFSGLLGGFLIELSERKKLSNANNKEIITPCESECCKPSPEARGKIKRMFSFGFITLLGDIAKPLILGVVIAAVISISVPDNYIGALLGAGFGTMFLMMLLGIPLYVCATASVPVAAAFIAKGISPGAALVFLMTGPATNAATITTFWKIMGRWSTIIYLFSIAVSALASGFLLDQLNLNFSLGAPLHYHESSPALWQHSAAVTLLCLILFSLLKHGRKHSNPQLLTQPQ